MAEIFAWLNSVLLAFTLVGFTLGTILFRFRFRVPILGSWFFWMFIMWWIVMAYDQIGTYLALRTHVLDPVSMACRPKAAWYLESRLALARLGVLWGIYYCIFYGFMRSQGVAITDLVKPFINGNGHTDERGE